MHKGWPYCTWWRGPAQRYHFQGRRKKDKAFFNHSHYFAFLVNPLNSLTITPGLPTRAGSFYSPLNCFRPTPMYFVSPAPFLFHGQFLIRISHRLSCRHKIAFLTLKENAISKVYSASRKILPYKYRLFMRFAWWGRNAFEPINLNSNEHKWLTRHSKRHKLLSKWSWMCPIISLII